MNYALHEALTLVLEEGLAARWQRHLTQHLALKSGLAALGIRYLADPAHQLPMLNAVAAPEGVEEGAVRKRLLEEYAIEIGGGLGAYKGRAWRIGLMGETATAANVARLTTALGKILSA
jgi:alanine-glyoxylate transaminase/serine-glyoxylate transaminase/serine-pyruvate transaminase